MKNKGLPPPPPPPPPRRIKEGKRPTSLKPKGRLRKLFKIIFKAFINGK